MNNYEANYEKVLKWHHNEEDVKVTRITTKGVVYELKGERVIMEDPEYFEIADKYEQAKSVE